MSQVNVWMAFAAGMASFLSPCVLPLVPGYVSIISGVSLEEISKGTEHKAVIRRAGIGSVFFVLGFGLVFSLLGASASAMGKLIEQQMFIFSKVAGTVIILFGLHTIWEFFRSNGFTMENDGAGPKS